MYVSVLSALYKRPCWHRRTAKFFHSIVPVHCSYKKRKKEVEFSVGLRIFNLNTAYNKRAGQNLYKSWFITHCLTIFYCLNLQQRNEMIAHLKDQLQEMKAKTSMEGKYIKKDAEVQMISLYNYGIKLSWIGSFLCCVHSCTTAQRRQRSNLDWLLKMCTSVWKP